MALRMSECQSASVSSGKPNIRSTLILLIPACLRQSTALATSSDLWRRRRKRNLASLNVWAPILTLFTGNEDRNAANPLSTSSGLHSMVTSSADEQSITENKRSRSRGPRVLGVPPPIYTVCHFPSVSDSLSLSSDMSASTYLSLIEASVVE